MQVKPEGIKANPADLSIIDFLPDVNYIVGIEEQREEKNYVLYQLRQANS